MNEIKTQHADKCASKIKHRYFGDRRNGPNGDEMEDCDCDGYHTFDELYEHRIVLFIALCKEKNKFYKHLKETYKKSVKDSLGVWRAKLHSDGTSFDGWFILGIDKEKGKQITYHLPISKWEETEFAETLDKAPEWDGHTSDDVLERLKKI